MNIFKSWNLIVAKADKILSRENSYKLRTRLNPHHSKEDKDYEKSVFLDLQQQDWKVLKVSYMANREEFLDFVSKSGTEKDKELINTLEKVFTKEVEEALGLFMDETETK